MGDLIEGNMGKRDRIIDRRFQSNALKVGSKRILTSTEHTQPGKLEGKLKMNKKKLFWVMMGSTY